jgi:hypothetical protein
VPVTVRYLDTLTAHPSAESVALFDQCDLYRRVFACEVEGGGESGDTPAEDHNVIGRTVMARHALSDSGHETVRYE